jgi:hypothetical protein
VWQTLGYEPEDTEWRTPMPTTLPPGWAMRRAADLRFARQHLLPWIGRRLTGRSSGDGITPLPVPYWGDPVCAEHCREIGCYRTWDDLWPDGPPASAPHTHRAAALSEPCVVCATPAH